ncbi:CLUMA_CG013945, isoform A [Clunio marinus]|uniref:CLUMA_CG013945, isoform A n=1 Tax=Clunio marinus TaxID=568069 RepID=A0A1J1INL5_9DIPT|nr:CLUMA_CG013945, isoform A [Clunio marinus]
MGVKRLNLSDLALKINIDRVVCEVLLQILFYTPTHKHLNSVTIPISKYDEESELNDLSMTNIRKEDDDVDNNNMKNLLNQRNNKCLMSLMSQRSCYSLPNH